MAAFVRAPATQSQRTSAILWTITALGSAFIAYNYVETKKYNYVFEKIGISPRNNVSPTRMKILLYFTSARVIRQIFFFWKLLSMEVKPSVAVGIQVANCIMDLLALTLAARNKSPSPNLIDKLGIILFTIGSILETGYDTQRWVWKQDPANAGKPYVEGFAKYVAHPNYLGFTLWRTGYFIVSGNIYASTLIPLSSCYYFIFNAIPNLQEYNKKKYGKLYEDYLAKTWNFIPFLW